MTTTREKTKTEGVPDNKCNFHGKRTHDLRVSNQSAVQLHVASWGRFRVNKAVVHGRDTAETHTERALSDVVTITPEYCSGFWQSFCLGLNIYAGHTRTCTPSASRPRDRWSQPTSPPSRPHAEASPHIVTLNPHTSSSPSAGARRTCLDAKAPCRVGHTKQSPKGGSEEER